MLRFEMRLELLTVNKLTKRYSGVSQPLYIPSIPNQVAVSDANILDPKKMPGSIFHGALS